MRELLRGPWDFHGCVSKEKKNILTDGCFFPHDSQTNIDITRCRVCLPSIWRASCRVWNHMPGLLMLPWNALIIFQGCRDNSLPSSSIHGDALQGPGRWWNSRRPMGEKEEQKVSRWRVSERATPPHPFRKRRPVKLPSPPPPPPSVCTSPLKYLRGAATHLAPRLLSILKGCCDWRDLKGLKKRKPERSSCRSRRMLQLLLVDMTFRGTGLSYQGAIRSCVLWALPLWRDTWLDRSSQGKRLTAHNLQLITVHFCF